MSERINSVTGDRAYLAVFTRGHHLENETYITSHHTLRIAVKWSLIARIGLISDWIPRTPSLSLKRHAPSTSSQVKPRMLSGFLPEVYHRCSSGCLSHILNAMFIDDNCFLSSDSPVCHHRDRFLRSLVFLSLSLCLSITSFFVFRVLDYVSLAFLFLSSNKPHTHVDRQTHIWKRHLLRMFAGGLEEKNEYAREQKISPSSSLLTCRR